MPATAAARTLRDGAACRVRRPLEITRRTRVDVRVPAAGSVQITRPLRTLFEYALRGLKAMSHNALTSRSSAASRVLPFTFGTTHSRTKLLCDAAVTVAGGGCPEGAGLEGGGFDGGGFDGGGFEDGGGFDDGGGSAGGGSAPTVM